MHRDPLNADAGILVSLSAKAGAVMKVVVLACPSGLYVAPLLSDAGIQSWTKRVRERERSICLFGATDSS
jgi:hypothetical protein